jgi:hypothetical protein
MFRCDQCSVVVPPAVKQHPRVVAYRATKFPFREDAWRRRESGRRQGRKLWFDDVGGDGLQIVAEQRLCEACAAVAPQPERPKLTDLPKAKRAPQRGRLKKRRS